MIDDLLKRNAHWAANRTSKTPDYFEKLADHQTPEFFWIGCSDSRVPANVIAGLDPGEVFVHCNVANVVHSSDMNLLSALEYAVDALGVREIIVCGHHGCGGVKAATESLPHGLADHWLEPVRRLARARTLELAQAKSEAERQNALAELNVIDGVQRVAQTPIMQRAWQRGDEISVYGLIYGMCDGRLRNLNCTITGSDQHVAPAHSAQAAN